MKTLIIKNVEYEVLAQELDCKGDILAIVRRPKGSVKFLALGSTAYQGFEIIHKLGRLNQEVA